MPPRNVVPIGAAEAQGSVIAELVDRVNQLSLLNGLPELRSRSVVPIPSSTLLMVFGVFSALAAGVLLRRAR